MDSIAQKKLVLYTIEESKDPSPATTLNELYKKVHSFCLIIAEQVKNAPDTSVIIAYENSPLTSSHPPAASPQLMSHYKKMIFPLPLATYDTDSQSSLGTMLLQLNNTLQCNGTRRIATELSSRVIIQHENIFDCPFVEVGTYYTEAEAIEIEKSYNWKMKPVLCNESNNKTKYWRRSIPSAIPLKILDISAIEALLDAGIIPITLKNGGTPVIPSPQESRTQFIGNFNVLFECKDPEKIKPLLTTPVECVIPCYDSALLLLDQMKERAALKGQSLQSTVIRLFF